MDLGLRGKSLQSVLIEYTVGMQLSDGYFIVIESPFRLDVDGDSFSLSPEEEPDDASRRYVNWSATRSKKLRPTQRWHCT